MKKLSTLWLVILMIAALLAGCGTSATPESAATEPSSIAATEAPATEPVEEPTEVVSDATEEDVSYEGDAASYYTEAYAQQIERYYTALSENWELDKYDENGMSMLAYYYYEGNPLENVGYDFVDLDNDGQCELIIGAILNSEMDPSVFEIWTLVDGNPVMLAQSSGDSRYILLYVEEDEMWYVANVCSNSAANHATYYLMLSEGKFEVMQGIILDAIADEQNPWFMAYDLDWDVSNDEPIDEETANAILESHRIFYTALEYCPYIFYK